MVPDISLGVGVPSLVFGLVRLFFFFIPLVSKSCEVLGRDRLGFCISIDFSFFLA